VLDITQSKLAIFCLNFVGSHTYGTAFEEYPIKQLWFGGYLMFQAYIKLVGNNDLSEKKRVSFVLDLFGFCNYVTKMLHFSKHPSNCSFFRIIKTLFMTLIYKTCLKRYKSRQFVQMSAFVDDYSP
jgi:hypothetical protein